MDKVDHPRLAGMVENVERVVDSLRVMFNRKEIDLREFMAAEKYRDCYAMLYSPMGGALDFDRIRGGSQPGHPPGLTYMAASEAMRDAKHRLYPRDWAVVHRICGLGFTTEETTAHLYGIDEKGLTSRTQRDACKGRFRAGLEILADLWWPEHVGSEKASMRSFVNERPVSSDLESVPKGNAVHATRDKVYRSGK